MKCLSIIAFLPFAVLAQIAGINGGDGGITSLGASINNAVTSDLSEASFTTPAASGGNTEATAVATTTESYVLNGENVLTTRTVFSNAANGGIVDATTRAASGASTGVSQSGSTARSGGNSFLVIDQGPTASVVVGGMTFTGPTTLSTALRAPSAAATASDGGAARAFDLLTAGVLTFMASAVTLLVL